MARPRAWPFHSYHRHSVLSATYTGAASPWTQAIDAALLAWSPFVVGDAEFRIDIQFSPLERYLAAHTTLSSVSAGKLADDRSLYVPASLAKLQGLEPSGPDFRITFDPSDPWSIGGAATGRYDLNTLARHEVGHALGLSTRNGNAATPWQVANGVPRADLAHLADKSALMWTSFHRGELKDITPADVAAVSAGGAPTALDDTIYVVGPRVDGGAGHDTAVWLGKFDAFTAELMNIEVLCLRGADPLTAHQADVYRLYDAAFDRDPDLAGFTWWAASGMDAHAIASAFATSAEFAHLYSGDRSAIVTALYRNVLDREPDAGGLAYWLGSDHDNATLLVGFALSTENALGPVEFTV